MRKGKDHPPVDPQAPKFYLGEILFELPFGWIMWGALVIALLCSITEVSSELRDTSWGFFWIMFVFVLICEIIEYVEYRKAKERYAHRQREIRQWLESAPEIMSLYDAVSGIDELIARKPKYGNTRQYPDIRIYQQEIQDRFYEGLFLFEPLEPVHDKKHDEWIKEREELRAWVQGKSREEYLEKGYKSYQDIVSDGHD